MAGDVRSVLERAFEDLVAGWSAPAIEVDGSHGCPASDADDWHRPFFAPAPTPADGPADTAGLRRAVEAVLAEDPSRLPEEVALARTADLLELSERLQAALLQAVADVDARQSFALDAAGSTRSWLRQSAGGDNGRLALARRLASHPQVRAALAAGTAGLAAASHVARELDRLPEQLPEDQLVGVLAHGLPDTLHVAFGGSLTEESRTDAQAALSDELQRVVAEALTDVTGTPAQRLEPAFVLLAKALPLQHLQQATGRLLDALEPRRLADEERRTWEARSWRLVKKRLTPGFRLEADLTDEEGLALRDEVDARLPGVAAARAAAASGPTHDPAPAAPDRPEVGGRATESVEEPIPASPAASAADDQLAAPASRDQLRHDAFVQLVRDAAAARGSGGPCTGVTVLVGLAALAGAAGVLPGALHGQDGAVTLSAEAVRRLGCGGPLSVVLLDAARNPVGASSTRRHATARERRALRARQGHLCAIAGCPSAWTVPHHVEPWWKTGRTMMRDLVGICEHCHHDVHDGHRTLRLRDGRRIGEAGWVPDAGDE